MKELGMFRNESGVYVLLEFVDFDAVRKDVEGAVKESFLWLSSIGRWIVMVLTYLTEKNIWMAWLRSLCVHLWKDITSAYGTYYWEYATVYGVRGFGRSNKERRWKSPQVFQVPLTGEYIIIGQEIVCKLHNQGAESIVWLLPCKTLGVLPMFEW